MVGVIMRSGNLQSLRQVRLPRSISQVPPMGIQKPNPRIDQHRGGSLDQLRGGVFGRKQGSGKSNVLKARAGSESSHFSWEYEPSPKRIDILVDTRPNPYSCFKEDTTFYVTVQASFGLPWLYPILNKTLHIHCLDIISTTSSEDEDGVRTYRFSVEFNKVKCRKTWGEVGHPRLLVKWLKNSLTDSVPEADIVTASFEEPFFKASEFWGKCSPSFRVVSVLRGFRL